MGRVNAVLTGQEPHGAHLPGEEGHSKAIPNRTNDGGVSQTRIFVLNAAVEAALAHESEGGFTVHEEHGHFAAAPVRCAFRTVSATSRKARLVEPVSCARLASTSSVVAAGDSSNLKCVPLMPMV